MVSARAGAHVLALNAGSSSIKFAVFDADGDGPAQLRGSISGLGTRPRMRVERRGQANETLLHGGRGEGDAGAAFARDFRLALDALAQTLAGETMHLLAVGHRVVHGGGEHVSPVVVDDAVLASLERLVPLAPLHEPYALSLIGAMRQRYPEVVQVASFDTAFHASQPTLERQFALPRELSLRGIRRYGFHGLSYAFVAECLAAAGEPRARGRTVVAHLGQGASLCAMLGLRSVATTMGFSALDGLPMGRRCGNLDAGVVLYLIQQLGMTADEVQHLLYERSGLLGVSGLSDDMRELESSHTAEAREAVALFVHRTNQWLGALAATLGGLDALVFTGGIGENSATVRAAICRLAAWLGIDIDPAANRDGASWIHSASSRVAVGIVATDEERMVARNARALAVARV
jgi:acetate kinase